MDSASHPGPDPTQEPAPDPGPPPAAVPAAGLAVLSSLLALFGGLVAVWAATDSDLLLIPLLAMALGVCVLGVVLAAGATRARADAARLDDLEPLPPAPGRQEGAA
ncbi:hypothetical protein [Streptomyces mayteni]